MYCMLVLIAVAEVKSSMDSVQTLLVRTVNIFIRFISSLYNSIFIPPINFM